MTPSRASTPPPVLDEDLFILKELQQQFDDEDSRLRTERAALVTFQPLTFTCAVCTDEHSEDYVARVPGCDHGFCRDCLKMYTVSKLEEHRFPVLCPSCVAEGTGKEPGSKSWVPVVDAELTNHPLGSYQQFPHHRYWSLPTPFRDF